MAEKKTITVFGGTGFIGRNLIAKLAKKGFKIIVPT
ncbi:MAG: NAD-dependent epimerase/dehydratase family protein, partial [Candidatus Fonsibacter ubiquis]